MNDIKQVNSVFSKVQYESTNINYSEENSENEEYKERYEALFHRSMDCIYIHDGTGKFIDANKAALDLLGYSYDELKTLTFSDILVPDQLREAEGNARLIFSQKNSDITGKYTLRHKNGSLIYVETKSSVLLKGGEPYAIQGIARDITKHIEYERSLKLIAEKLKISEKKYTTLFNVSPDMILLTDYKTGKIIEINETFLVKSGKSKSEEVIGKSLGELNIWIDKDQRKEFLELFKEKGYIKDFETNLRMKSGEIRSFSLSSKSIYLNNEKLILTVCHDITEKKLAEIALKVSEAKYKTLIEKVPSVTYIASLDDVSSTLYISPQIEKYIKYSVNDLIMRPTLWSEIIHPEDRDRVFNSLQNLNKYNKRLSIDYRMIAADGDIVWFNDEAELITDNDENPLFLQGIMVDITDKKKAENQIQEQAELLRIIFDHIPLMICFFGKDGKIKIVNKEWEKVLGWTLDETVTHEDITKELYPDYQYREYVAKYINDSEERWSDFLTTVKDGRVLNTAWANIKLSDGTRIGIGRDVTEQKKIEMALYESEERLKLSLEGANEGLWDWNVQTGEVYFSPGYYTMLGYAPGEFPASYESILNLIHPCQLENVKKIVKEHLQDGKGTYENEFLVRRKDGSYHWILSRGKIFTRDENGNPVRMVGIHVDITERKKIEDAFRENEQRINIILKSLPISLFTLSLDNMHYTKWISDNVELLTGFSANNFTDSYDFWKERIHPEDLNKIIDLSNYINGVNINEHRWRCADGQYQWFLNYALIKTDKDGNAKEVIGTWQNIHERKLSEEKIRHSEEQLRSLTNHLESVREEERNNIAREVHDELGQSLTALKMIALSIKKKLSKENKVLAEKASDMAELISTIIQTVQKITSELRPQALESLGLIAALDWYFGEFKNRTRINCSLDININNTINFSEKQSITIYRIFQEALTNIARHSNAKRVIVSISSEDGMFYLKIEDNGKGLDTSKLNGPKSFGLIGMKERAFAIGGEVIFGSIKNKGTTIVVKIPVYTIL